MAKLSLALLAAASLVAAQVQTQLPVVEPAEGDDSCDRCYVIADVAGIYFGGVQTVTDVVFNSVGVSPNGTTVTTITSLRSATATQGQFTYEVGATDAPRPAIEFMDFDSTVEVGGAVLTSPTQYQVFTAYSVTRLISENGGCSTSRGSANVLPSAIQYTVPEDAPDDYLIDLEASFISQIGIPSCAPGGGIVSNTIQSRLSRETQEVTTRGPIRPTLVPATTAAVSSQAITPIATSSGATDEVGTVSVSSTTIIYNTSLPVGPSGTGGYTYAPIVPGTASFLSPTWLLGSVVAAVGLAAVLL